MSLCSSVTSLLSLPGHEGPSGDQVLMAWPPLLTPESDAPLFPQAVAMDALSLEQQLPYTFFTQAGSQQSTPPQPQPPPPPPPVSQQQPSPPPPQVPINLPPGSPLMPSTSLTQGPQLPPLLVTVPSSLPQSPPDNSGQPPMGIDIASVSPGHGRRGLALGPGCGVMQEERGAVGGYIGCPVLSAATQGSIWRPTCQGLGLKQTLPGAQYPMEFLLRMSPHVRMGKQRHKHISVPQTLPNMGYPCLAAKPFPMALDTCPALPIQNGASLEVRRAQLSGPEEQASASQRVWGDLGGEEGMQHSD